MKYLITESQNKIREDKPFIEYTRIWVFLRVGFEMNIDEVKSIIKEWFTNLYTMDETDKKTLSITGVDYMFGNGWLLKMS
jgi:hypothetical protein